MHFILDTRDTPPAIVAVGDTPQIIAHVAETAPAAYAGVMVDALNREFGTPEPAPAEQATFYGIAIPPALADVGRLLVDAEGLAPHQRTHPQNQAIARFIAYCDAEGIELPRKHPTEEEARK